VASPQKEHQMSNLVKQSAAFGLVMDHWTDEQHQLFATFTGVQQELFHDSLVYISEHNEWMPHYLEEATKSKHEDDEFTLDNLDFS
jgi:hypothetical protein